MGAFDARAEAWPLGEIPYIIKLPHRKADFIEACLDHISSVTDIRFYPTTDTKINRIEFVNEEYDANDKAIPQASRAGAGYRPNNGRDVIDNGAHVINITYNVRVLHEICHCLGMIHEHLRFDRDEFVTIDNNALDPKSSVVIPFYSIGSSVGSVRNDTLGFVMDTNPTTVKYDLESVMHYWYNAGGKDEARTITYNAEKDKKFVSRERFDDKLTDLDIECIQVKYNDEFRKREANRAAEWLKSNALKTLNSTDNDQHDSNKKFYIYNPALKQYLFVGDKKESTDYPMADHALLADSAVVRGREEVIDEASSFEFMPSPGGYTPQVYNLVSTTLYDGVAANKNTQTTPPKCTPPIASPVTSFTYGSLYYIYNRKKNKYLYCTTDYYNKEEPRLNRPARNFALVATAKNNAKGHLFMLEADASNEFKIFSVEARKYIHFMPNSVHELVSESFKSYYSIARTVRFQYTDGDACKLRLMRYHEHVLNELETHQILDVLKVSNKNSIFRIRNELFGFDIFSSRDAYCDSAVDDRATALTPSNWYSKHYVEAHSIDDGNDRYEFSFHQKIDPQKPNSNIYAIRHRKYDRYLISTTTLKVDEGNSEYAVFSTENKDMTDAKLFQIEAVRPANGKVITDPKDYKFRFFSLNTKQHVFVSKHKKGASFMWIPLDQDNLVLTHSDINRNPEENNFSLVPKK